MAKKSWQEKLQGSRPASVEVLDKPMMGLPAGTRIFIATPLLVKKYVDAIPKGSEKSVTRLRADLAKKNKADATCPLTTGIFLRIVAEATLDERKNGLPTAKMTPFWRVIDPKSPLAKKLSCGPEFILARRKAEGIKPEPSRKRSPSTSSTRRRPTKGD